MGSRFQQMVLEAEHDAEVQKERLERVELEYASHSMPYMQNIADLEARLRELDRRSAEAEAKSSQKLKEALDREAAGSLALTASTEEFKKREDEIRSEAAKSCAAEAAKAEVEISSASLAK